MPFVPAYLLIRPAAVNLFSKSGGKIKRTKLPASYKDSRSRERFALFAKKSRFSDGSEIRAALRAAAKRTWSTGPYRAQCPL
jgi:hypothetical protein